jgi:cell division protein FtsN
MKIFCMDCQTESQVEVGQLKDKQRFECEHCAKIRHNSLTNEMGMQLYVPEGDILDFHSVSSPDPLSESDVLQLDEDKPLEIPFLPAPPALDQPFELDEIISAPPDDLESVSPEESPDDVVVDDSLEKGEIFVLEGQRQIPSTPAPATGASAQQQYSLNPQQPIEEMLQEMSGMPKRVKVMTVKSPILIGVAVVSVLFIAFGDKIFRPAIKANPEAEISQPLTTPEQDIKAAPAVPASVQPEIAVATRPEPSKTVPTPVVQATETKPADAAPPAEQPPVAATAAGQFTVQVGSHNEVGQASEQVNKLRAAGFEARVVSVDIPKRGRWHRVQSGSFSNRAEANRHGAQILTKGAAANFVVAGT